jgi:hypothetical protein
VPAFVYGTERKLAELMSRELRGLELVALLIDGVHFAEHVVLAAVGASTGRFAARVAAYHSGSFVEART